MTLLATFHGDLQRIACGHGTWKKGRLGYGSLPVQPVAVSGGWTTDDSFTAKICFYETPFIVTLRLKFSGDQLLFDSESNVGFSPAAKQPQLVGKRE